MLKWPTLLSLEEELDYSLHRAVEDEGVLLYDPERGGYVPNPGGQERAWMEALGGFTPECNPSTHRWVVLGGGVGCIAGETMIDGVNVPVKDLAGRGWFPVRTLAGPGRAFAFLKGQADLYRVRLESGREILATKDHRFLSPKGWVKLRDLRVGEFLAVDDNYCALSASQRSKDSRDHCSADARQGDARPTPQAVFAQDIAQQPCEQHGPCIGRALRLSMQDGLPQTGTGRYFASAQYHAFSDGRRLLNYGRQGHLQSRSLTHQIDSDKSVHPSGMLCVGSSRTGDSFLAPALDHESLPPSQRHGMLRQDSRLRQHNSRILDTPQGSRRQRAFSSPAMHQIPSTSWIDAFSESPSHLAPDASFLALCKEPQSSQYSFGSPEISSGKWDAINSIEFVRHDDFYDLHVPGMEHYSAGGIYSHNSGKSYLGAVWIVHKALKHPNARFLISANSYPQLAQATLTTLAEVCMKYNIPLDPMLDTPEATALSIANRRPAHCYIGPGRAYCYVLSMSSFQGKTQTSRGLGCRAAWLDEAAYASEEAFNTLDGRLGRGPGKELEGSGIITTTPNGLNWVWSRAFDPSRSDSFKKTFTFFNCPTRENLEHLGDGYVTSLEGNYDGELAQQELMGAFLNTASGLVYRKFSRNAHGLRGDDAKCIGYDNTLRLHLNYDFNFTPAVCSAFHVRMNEVHAFKEWYVKESDVWELSEEIRDWLIKNNHQAEIWLHGDASGRARSAASRLSAWDIIWDTMKSGGFQMFKKYPKANPPVSNRVDAFNFLCKQDRFFIDIDNCPELVKDFENVTWDGENIDKSDILRTHLADSITYGVHFLYPYGGRNGPEKGSKAIPGFSA